MRSWDVKKRNKWTRWKRGKKQLNVDGRVCYMLNKQCLDFQRQIKHVNILSIILSYLGNWLCKILCGAITLQGASIQASDKPGSVGGKAWNLNGCFPGLEYSESSHFPVKIICENAGIDYIIFLFLFIMHHDLKFKTKFSLARLSFFFVQRTTSQIVEALFIQCVLNVSIPKFLKNCFLSPRQRSCDGI